MLTSSVFTRLSWSPVTDVRALFAFPFMQHALAAGTIVAVMAGVIGWFMVLRRQTFAGHTLSVTAFTGASAASLAGVPVAVGYFGICGLGALALGFLRVPGLSLAETRQITGALLVFALLVTPAATAHRITARPFAGVVLSVALALAVTWLGLALAYFSVYPVGFYITSLSFAVYVLARVLT